MVNIKIVLQPGIIFSDVVQSVDTGSWGNAPQHISESLPESSSL